MDVAKVIEIISASPNSFDDAIKEGVAKASKSLHGIRGIKVTGWTAEVQDNRVTKYKVTMDVAFHIDEKP